MRNSCFLQNKMRVTRHGRHTAATLADTLNKQQSSHLSRHDISAMCRALLAPHSQLASWELPACPAVRRSRRCTCLAPNAHAQSAQTWTLR